MSFNDILIVLGCVAAGFWIISSVMGPGIDIPRQQKPAAVPRPSSRPRSVLPGGPGMPGWYLLLDVSQGATRAEIEAAFLRWQKKAQADRDPLLLEKLKRARDAGLAQARHAATH